MNYYSHHIGDYCLHTTHLSLLEDGAYRRLMDRYYRLEGPLANDIPTLCRILRATTTKEKRAVETILREFFILTDQGWTHTHCDIELEAYRAKVKTNQTNGNKGGRPKKNPHETQVDISSNPDETLTKNQEPITIKQEPLIERRPPSESRFRKGTLLPNDFVIVREVRTWAEQNGYSNLEAHFINFVGKARANGYTYTDWNQAFQNAIREDWAKISTAAGPRVARQSRHNGFGSLNYSEGVGLDGNIN